MNHLFDLADAAVFRPRKKTSEQIAHLFAKAVESEIASLTQQLKEAAANMNKPMRDIGVEVFNRSLDLMVDTFDDAYGHIEGDDAARKVEIMQAYAAGDVQRHFVLSGQLYKQSIARQAERNVLENEVDTGD